MKIKSLLGAALLFSAGTALAAPIAISVDTATGTQYNTTGLSGYTTGPGDMDGMEITATFSDGSSDTAILGNPSATGTGWSVSFASGTTFSDPWNVNVNNQSDLLITNLLFSGANGDTVFDILSDLTHSPGSADGKAITDGDYTGTTLTSVEATYLNEVFVDGTFYGDLYESLSIDFAAGLATGDLFSFVADTDNLAITGDIDIVDVPTPATLALLGIGLLGAGAARRRA